MYWPSAAFTMTSKGTQGILVASEDAGLDGGATTWAQVLNEKGMPIGSPIQINAASDPQTIETGRIFPLPSNPTDPFFRFIWYATVQRIDGNKWYYVGDQILKVNLRLVP